DPHQQGRRRACLTALDGAEHCLRHAGPLGKFRQRPVPDGALKSHPLGNAILDAVFYIDHLTNIEDRLMSEKPPIVPICTYGLIRQPRLCRTLAMTYGCATPKTVK